MNALVGYIRVSTGKQGENGLGMQAQRRALDGAAAGRGMVLERVYRDVDSGSRTMRPGLQEALASLQPGDTLIVAKLDRLTRSVRQFAGLLERAKTDGWHLVALDMGIDTSTPQGELMVYVLASFAQFERRLTSERTVAALKVARANGVTLGRPQVIPDTVVRRIKQLKRKGMSYNEIARVLTREKIPTAQGAASWSRATVTLLDRSKTRGRRSGQA